MGITVLQNVRKILGELGLRYKDQRFSHRVLENAIMVRAGCDPRTVKRYIQVMQRFRMIAMNGDGSWAVRDYEQYAKIG